VLALVIVLGLDAKTHLRKAALTGCVPISCATAGTIAWWRCAALELLELDAYLACMATLGLISCSIAEIDSD
jgi:hypothetical protein